MSKLTESESMALQMVLVPAKKHWDSEPRHMAEEIQQGKRPREVVSGRFSKMTREVGKTVEMGFKDLVSKSSSMNQQSKDERPVHLTPM